MAQGKAGAAISRLSQINREMAERRSLRERKSAAVKQQVTDSLQRQGAVAERTAKHLGELARRQKGAGGWVTEKALADKDKVLVFGPEDEQASTGQFSDSSAATPAAHPSPPPQHALVSAPPPAEPPQRKYSRSVAPPPDPDPEPEPAAPPPPPRRVRRRQEEAFDDDFSNHSWLR
jgi:hypothetical protein